jgi:hypothetical protein
VKLGFKFCAQFGPVIILEHDGIAEIHAMVETAAASDGVFPVPASRGWFCGCRKFWFCAAYGVDEFQVIVLMPQRCWRN